MIQYLAYRPSGGLAFPKLLCRNSKGVYNIRLEEGSQSNSLLPSGESLCDPQLDLDGIARQVLVPNYLDNALVQISEIEELRTKPHESFGRIWRPGTHSHAGLKMVRAPWLQEREMIDFCENLMLLIERWKFIASVVSPCDLNFSTFGNEIRNLLLLTCTEVETLFKSIMFGGGGSKKSSMKDYFVVSALAKLPIYEVRFTRHPSLGNIVPFAEWDPSGGEGFRSLSWYKAYNDTKHDRQKNLGEASFKNVSYSLAACLVLLVAQLPPHEWDPKRSDLFRTIADTITVNKKPEWTIGEFYFEVRPRTIDFRPISKLSIQHE